MTGAANRAISFEDEEKALVFDNPYLVAAAAAGVDIDCMDVPWYQRPLRFECLTKRWDLVKRYAFAIPNTAAIGALADLGPILEIGAGSGYWTWCLRQVGCDVVAVDKVDPKGLFLWPEPFVADVLDQDATDAVIAHPGRTLMACWPYMDSMAVDALKAFTGQRFIYIGEPAGGCTGDDALFGVLDAGWDEERLVRLPQWPGVHDDLYIYRRR